MVTVRGVEIGTGKPKICVPITGKTVEEIFKQAKEIAPLLVEVAEWRVDYTEFAHDKDTILLVLEGLRKQLQNKILLFTFRTKKEGGEQELSEEEYFNLNKFAAETKLVDLIDLELFSSDDKLEFYMNEIHKSGCTESGFNSRFVSTAPIVKRLPYSGLISKELFPIEPSPHKTAVCFIEISPFAVILSASQYSLGASHGTGTARQ